MAVLVDGIQSGELGPSRGLGCFKLPSLVSYIERREYPSSSETTEFLPHPHEMALKKAVTALRPAVTGLAPRIWRPECSRVANYSTRTRAAPAPRPRGLTRLSQQQARYASSETANEQLGKTGLYELHSKYGAKFVPFGGYAMPVQYSDMSIIDSHNWTREKASLFDVGHM
jgi:aminomethyltransferase